LGGAPELWGTWARQASVASAMNFERLTISASSSRAFGVWLPICCPVAQKNWRNHEKLLDIAASIYVITVTANYYVCDTKK